MAKFMKFAPKWQEMNTADEGDTPLLRRFQVPGGWLYHVRGTMVFVKDEESYLYAERWLDEGLYGTDPEPNSIYSRPKPDPIE